MCESLVAPLCVRYLDKPNTDSATNSFSSYYFALLSACSSGAGGEVVHQKLTSSTPGQDCFYNGFWLLREAVNNLLNFKFCTMNYIRYSL